MKNKKALSTVIATVLLILLVTASTAIVWAFVNNIVSERTEGVQSCFDVESSEKVTLNDYYTCFDYTEGEVQFSIKIEDVEIEGIVVSISSGGNSKSFTLSNNEEVIQNLRPYKGGAGEAVNLPGKNEGKTYIASGFSGETEINSIKISCIVDGKQCGLSDSTSNVADCSILAS